ncbi:MAG: helix-turn-helix transcriptional regulator [Rivularia sp. (in: Bacteria)]|nr:helix-turn-helix transcriptional regulator [Rivularia sp. MS3]
MAKNNTSKNKRKRTRSVSNPKNSGVINISNFATKVDPNLLLDCHKLLTVLQSDLSDFINEIATTAAIKLIEKETLGKLHQFEYDTLVKKLAKEIAESFTEELKDNSELQAKTENLLPKDLPVVEQNLKTVVPIPSSAVMFSSMEALNRKDLWQKDTEGMAYLQHRAKGNPNNYIEHYICSPGDITMLPWNEAQQIIDKFGFTTAKLHLIFAAHAMNQENPWRNTFNLKASDIIQEFGWDKNHEKPKPEKLLEIASTAFALDCLLVKTVWVEGKNNKGEIIGSVPIGRMWNVQIQVSGQLNLEGKINNPDEVYITIQPGLWTQDFLNRAGAKSREALYQFGYLAQQVLKIDPYHDELALRLAIYLTLDSRVRLDGKYRVIELLETAFPKTVIDKARSDFRRAYDLKQRWDSAIKLLLKLGWQVVFDPETYPEWLKPDSKDKKPKGYLAKLLDAKLTIKPPAPIPELIASKSKPKRKPLQSKAKVTSPPQNTCVTSSQIREARTAKGWAQAKLAGFLGVSQKLISLIERGERTLNPELAAQIQTLLDIQD